MNQTVPLKLQVRIDGETVRRVHEHARAHMQHEVCGVLVGRMCDGVIEIEAPIEAFNASQAGAHVTFTQAAWETIFRVKDRDFPDDRIVGWYHSHPGFGIFLSEHDTFIHQNFFSSPDQVAWVYDPHSDDEGCFGWVDGVICRIETMDVTEGSGPQRQQKATEMPPEDAVAHPVESPMELPVESSGAHVNRQRKEARLARSAAELPAEPARQRSSFVESLRTWLYSRFSLWSASISASLRSLFRLSYLTNGWRGEASDLVPKPESDPMTEQTEQGLSQSIMDAPNNTLTETISHEVGK
jgi:proteasome lid subunit RPN8/RPN11